jgi:hypothetical protein
MPNVMAIDELQEKMNPRGWPHFEASAPNGVGVFDTLKMIIKLVLDKAKNSSTSKRQSAISASQPVPQPVSAPAMQSSDAPAFERTPVYASASQPEPPAQADVVPRSESFRPYPGSSTQRVQPSTGSGNAQYHSPTRQEIADSSSSHAQSTMNQTVVGANGIVTPPSMAPSMRKRQEAKKPGFFKRLFGMK